MNVLHVGQQYPSGLGSILVYQQEVTQVEIDPEEVTGLLLDDFLNALTRALQPAVILDR